MACVWIDLANSPHVLFFTPVVADLHRRGYEVLLTARDFAQTVPLARQAGLACHIIGRHGGRGAARKAANLLNRGVSLARFARRRRIDLAVSHNSYAQVVAARMLRIPCATLMDYEYQPANHVSFRLADLVMVPRMFHEAALDRFGAAPRRTFKYEGLKEEVYLDGFTPEPAWRSQLVELFGAAGIPFEPQRDVLIAIRPPPTMAAYHDFENPLFPALLAALADRNVRQIVLPRTPEQRRELNAYLPAGALMPEKPLDGRELVAASDAIISAGGTMVREACVLGTPAVSLYWGRLGGVDESLARSGRLRRIRAIADIDGLDVRRKSEPTRRVTSDLRGQIIERLLRLTDT